MYKIVRDPELNDKLINQYGVFTYYFWGSQPIIGIGGLYTIEDLEFLLDFMKKEKESHD